MSDEEILRAGLMHLDHDRRIEAWKFLLNAWDTFTREAQIQILAYGWYEAGREDNFFLEGVMDRVVDFSPEDMVKLGKAIEQGRKVASSNALTVISQSLPAERK